MVMMDVDEVVPHTQEGAIGMKLTWSKNIHKAKRVMTHIGTIIVAIFAIFGKIFKKLKKNVQFK